MTFTDNHDKNSWEGTQYSNFGDGLQACMVFCTVVNGMPMVYGGQEAGLNKSLKFFDKETSVINPSRCGLIQNSRKEIIPTGLPTQLMKSKEMMYLRFSHGVIWY